MSLDDVSIRGYADADYEACRALWVELTEHHRRIYDDATIGGDDPGAYFDTYLANPARAGTWVAVRGDEIVGFPYMTIQPVARNTSAIAAFHSVGFQAIGHVQLTIDLDRPNMRWKSGLSIHGLEMGW